MPRRFVRRVFTLVFSVIATALVFSPVFLFAGIGPAVKAAEFPPATVPENAGVNTGVTTLDLDDRDFSRMRKAGIRYIRIDLIWSGIERTKGVYDWSRFDEVIAKLKAHEIKPIFILDYNNKLYDPAGGGIRTDRARQGFARYAAAAVGRYNRQMPGIIWEVWNEPNANNFWEPKRNADEFVALVKAAVPAMREADPSVTVISGGITEIYWDVTRAYLERCFELGLLDVVDGLGVHLYGGSRNIYPERMMGELADLRERMAAHGKGADYPILHTEFGTALEKYSEIMGPSREKQELGQARTYVRMYLLGLLENVGIHIWYEWRRRNDFSRYAILNSDGTPRTAYTAIATVNNQLKGYEFDKRIPEFGKNDFILAFEKDGKRKLVIWTAGDARTVAIPVGTSAESLKATTMTGEVTSIVVKDGRLTASLSGSPAYIDLGTAALAD